MSREKSDTIERGHHTGRGLTPPHCTWSLLSPSASIMLALTDRGIRGSHPPSPATVPGGYPLLREDIRASKQAGIRGLEYGTPPSERPLWGELAEGVHFGSHWRHIPAGKGTHREGGEAVSSPAPWGGVQGCSLLSVSTGPYRGIRRKRERHPGATGMLVVRVSLVMPGQVREGDEDLSRWRTGYVW